MRTSSLYQSLSSLRKSATVGECVRRDSIVRGRVVLGCLVRICYCLVMSLPLCCCLEEGIVLGKVRMWLESLKPET